MAEREVVAVLIIDETGAVRSVNALRDSLPKLERQTKDTANIFTERMFSMRHAAIAFLGGFTLAGVLLQLRQFATNLIESAGAFGEFKKKADELDFRFKEFLVHVLDINGGLQEMTNWMDRLIFLGDQIAKVDTTGIGVVKKFLFGATPIGSIMRVLDYTADVIDKARAAQPGVGPMQGPPVPSGFFPGAEAPAGLGNNIYAPGLLGKTFVQGLGLVDIAKRLPDQLSLIEEMSNPLRDTWSEMQEKVEGIANGWRDVGTVFEEDLIGTNLITTDRHITGLTGHIEEAIEAYEKFQTVAQAASEAINAAAAAGVISQRTAVRAQMALMAIQSILEGKIEVAKAAKAVADRDYVGAVLHATAAGLFFAAAGFEAHVARVGPASGAAVGGAGNFTAGGQFASGPQRPAVTIIIEGNVVGNEEFIRDHIVPGIQKAFTDNANGGSFA